MQDSRLVHGSNLSQKEKHQSKYKNAVSRKYLGEIRAGYNQWNKENMALRGPGVKKARDDNAIIKKRVSLLENYKEFIDQQHYAEQFDSRSNLHSSVLEEFMFYLFKD